MLLARQMLIFADPPVGHVGGREVDRPDRLILFLVERAMVELQAPVRKLAEAEIEIFVDRTGVDDVPPLAIWAVGGWLAAVASGSLRM